MNLRFMQNMVFTAFSLAVVTAGVFGFQGRWSSGLAVLVSVCWALLNGYLLYQIINLGVAQKQAVGKKMTALLLIKFPVIYLAGFFILKTDFFPPAGILIGLTLFAVALLVSWMRAKSAVLAAIMTFFYSAAAFAMEHAPAAAEHGTEHGGGHGGDSAALHTSTFVTVLAKFLPKTYGDMLLSFENVIFCVLVVTILSLIFYAASKQMSFIPGRLQSACEAIVAALNNFVCGIIGPEGRKYTPFLGTLFLYILTMNLLGLLPLMKSNTANSITLAGSIQIPIPTTTVALAIIVFIVVQTIGIKKQGILGYLDHMAGSPRDAFGWVMAPLMFPIHLIGELAKPFSLTFRLFCNIMGGHVLVAVFIGMGIATAFIPFQAPFLLFEIVTSTIQALVFTLLSTVYIAMMLPHHDHEEEHEGGAHTKHEHAKAH